MIIAISGLKIPFEISIIDVSNNYYLVLLLDKVVNLIDNLSYRI